jgi:hypothetical protein
MKEIYLPITQSILDTYKNYLYPFLYSIYAMTDNAFCYADRSGVAVKIILDPKLRSTAQKESGMSAKSFNDHIAPDVVLCQDEFVCLMPLQVWEAWIKFLNQQHKRSWNSWTKLFCYVYFQCSRHTGCSFTHSREQFAKSLEMQPASVSEKLIILEKCGFIMRTNYNADQGIARAYSLPEKYWPEYRILEKQKLSTK